MEEERAAVRARARARVRERARERERARDREEAQLALGDARRMPLYRGYRVDSRIRTRTALGPHSRSMLKALWWS